MSQPSAKHYTLDTHRSVAPGETLARVRPHLARMGITRVANVTGLDRIGIPVVMVSRPNSRSVAVSQGKGLSLISAEASGVMEAVETWHAERIALPLRYAALSDLGREAAVVDVGRLPRVRGGRFHEDRRIMWIEGRDAARQETAWLPYEMVHTDYTRPTAPGHGCFPRSTNGLASGNQILEATCHAICELIERDATTLWHHLPSGAQDRTRLRLAGVDDPGCAEALRRLAEAGFEVAVWETTSDVGVAAFRCLIVEADGRPGHIGIGDGCHPHRGIALLRALTEAVQTRLTYVSGARDDLLPEEFTGEAIAGKCGYARGMIRRAGEMRDFAACPHRVTEAFDDDLAWLRARLTAVGCDRVFTVDLSRPEIGMAVVRAVIPGLEAPHDDDDFVAGPRAIRAGGGAP
jgi:ribosomal protein S12 methylthiotransferase accessory factor